MKSRFWLRDHNNILMKGDECRPVVRTWFVLCCVSVAWFTSAVCSSNALKLLTNPEVVARCGENVTLSCNASSLKETEIRKFSWLSTGKTVCLYGGEQHDPEVVCENKSEALQSSLSVTLINMVPAKQGEYLCKLHSTRGIEHMKTVVKLQECFQRMGFSHNKSHAECWFDGFYPEGSVHWFQASGNLTESASIEDEQDQHGLYKVKSILKLEPQNTNYPYRCSLWIPAMSKYLSNQSLVHLGKIRSSGSTVSIPWMCATFGTLLVRFMM